MFSTTSSITLKYLFIFAGDIDGAKSILQTCLESDPNFVDAHILMAQVNEIISLISE